MQVFLLDSLHFRVSLLVLSLQLVYLLSLVSLFGQHHLDLSVVLYHLLFQLSDLTLLRELEMGTLFFTMLFGLP